MSERQSCQHAAAARDASKLLLHFHELYDYITPQWYNYLELARVFLPPACLYQASM